MRISTIVFGCALVLFALVRHSDAVACSTTVTENCTDCSLAANKEDADCLATTAAPATTVSPDATTTTTASTATTTVTPSSNRRLLRRIRNLQNRLDQCKKQAAKQRASLIKQIKKLTANANANANNFKNKFFG